MHFSQARANENCFQSHLLCSEHTSAYKPLTKIAANEAFTSVGVGFIEAREISGPRPLES